MMGACHKDKRASFQGLPLDETIWTSKILRIVINYQPFKETDTSINR